jgi:hypothetical protein
MTVKEYEQSILAKYSTPGLRRNTLSREAKRDHLAMTYKGMSQEQVKLILDRMYGPEERKVPRYGADFASMPARNWVDLNSQGGKQ